MQNKISVNNLIFTGIFLAVYLIILYGTAMIGYIPILIFTITPLVGLIAGIPLVLYFNKIDSFGCVSIFGIVFGLITYLSTGFIFVLISGCVFGIIADLCLWAGKKRNKINMTFASIFISFIGSTVPLPLWIETEAYLGRCVGMVNSDYIATMFEFAQQKWLGGLIFILGAIGAILGTQLGCKVLNKHFKRSGIV